MITISTRIPEGMDKELSALARATDRKKGYLLQRALEHYLDERKKPLGGKTGTKKKKTEDDALREDMMRLSQDVFAGIWDNHDDAVYDTL